MDYEYSFIFHSHFTDGSEYQTKTFEQWGSEYQTFEYCKNLNTKHFDAQISNGSVCKW